MPADLINLRQARKSRARVAKETQARENRAKFGRSKAERLHTAAADVLEQHRHEGHERAADAPPFAADTKPDEPLA